MQKRLSQMSLLRNRLQALKSLTLSTPNHIHFRHWVHLYHRRFPYQELAPVTSIARSLVKENAVITGLINSANNRWAGFTQYEYYGNSVLLAYLATAPEFEGRGLARQMVESLVNQTLGEKTPYFWLEASPKLWAFYAKLGFKRLDFEYRIPEFYSSGSEKMGLFVRLDKSVAELKKGQVEAFVSELLLSGYDIKESDWRYQRQMKIIRDYPKSTVKVV